ncbi:hypothetical protein AX17_005412 [Amanita inopinata Kibby_2008]|nr:hypothetical protein AX17_005412 [Amanita inopinata Kibby_2008]
MPTAARKSSIGGARRGIQKAHIPYRGDNPAVGKKTGIAVRNVERKSDGFEPFEEVMLQADKRTPPPLVKSRRKKKSVVIEEEEYDENGEMSMELDNSPMPYFTSARQLATPSNISRVMSTSRIVARTPETDFDKVPSPRPRLSSRKSVTHGGPGRSKLSITSTARPSSPGQGLGQDYNTYDDDFHYGADLNGVSHPNDFSPGRDSPQQTSFTQMDQDDDDDEGNEPFQEPDVPDEIEDDPPIASKAKLDKGKRRAEAAEDSGDELAVEQEVAYDLDGDGHMDEEPEPEPEPRPKKKKLKVAVDISNIASERSRSRSKKENKPHREGVRRSTREHIKPLEWWRGERYVYGRAGARGPVMVPPIKEIMRIPKEQPMPLGAKRRRTGRGRSKSKAVEQPAVLYNPEEGWDDDTPDKCMVLEYPGNEERLRRIAFTAHMFQPQLAANNEWSYQKIFGDNEFIAAGQLTIPVQGRKPSKSSKDNTYIFYVAEGAVNFKVHNTSLVLSTGGMIMVPRGNTYYIENIADREAKLVFTQARKMPPSEEELQAQQLANNRRSIDSGLGEAHG